MFDLIGKEKIEREQTSEREKERKHKIIYKYVTNRVTLAVMNPRPSKLHVVSSDNYTNVS